MVAINFPDNPSPNDTFVSGDKTYVWNGAYWESNYVLGYTGSQGEIGYTGSSGSSEYPVIEKYKNAGVTTTTTGTGTITLGTPIIGFRSFESVDVADGDEIEYAIQDGTAWEYGTGTYSSTGPTISRDNIEESSNGGAAIDLSGDAVVFCDAFAVDLGGVVRLYDINVTGSPSSIVCDDLNQGFSKYIIDFNVNIPGPTIIMRTSSDGGMNFDDGAEDYRYHSYSRRQNSTNIVWSSGDSEIESWSIVSGGLWSFNISVLEAENTALPTSIHCNGATGSGIAYHSLQAQRDENGVVDAVEFYLPSGVFGLGVVSVWGVK